MESNWAVENLQVIRTLMERTAIYRRALAPVMLTVGALGLMGGIIGYLVDIDAPRKFALFWGGIGILALAAALLLVRRQALRAAEPFWSHPARRVSQAAMPPLIAGLLLVVAMFLRRWEDPLQAWWLPPIWMILYGCAMHASGFFMPRGMKLFGWIFIVMGGSLFLGLSTLGGTPSLRWGHLVMGAAFGGLHLLCGVYLYWTEKNTAGQSPAQPLL